jgi:NADH-quinone oxidoreductase subunit J
MVWVGQVYFYVCALVAIFGAVSTVVSRNPIRGAMGLLLLIVSIAGLFLALNAQFLAAIQLIVYAGAIVVLFLFVIMLLGPSATAPHDERGLYTRVFGGGLFAMAALGLIYMVVRGAKAVPFEPYGVLGPTAEDFGGIDAFGRVLFSDGLAPFELSSALLMVAVIGAVAVARGNQPNKFTVRTGGEGSGTSAGAARHEELPQ